MSVKNYECLNDSAKMHNFEIYLIMDDDENIKTKTKTEK